MPRHFFHAESHLKRAEQLLADGELESLFYAGLEFRYAVEARLLEYSEIASEYVRNKGSDWSATDLSKHVHGVFGRPESGAGVAVYSVEIISPKLPTNIILRYTPVTKETVSILGRVDNYLHSIGASKCHDQQVAGKLRALIDEGITRLTESISGGLQGPLLKRDGKITMVIDDDAHPALKGIIGKDDECIIRVEITPFVDSEGGKIKKSMGDA